MLLGKYVRPLWKQIIVLVFVTLCANAMTTVKPVVLSGFMNIILQDRHALNKEDPAVRSGQGKPKLFDLNQIGTRVAKYASGFLAKSEKGNQLDFVKVISVLLLIVVLLATVLNYWSEIMSRCIRVESTRLIRIDILKHLLSMNIGFFHRQKGGEILSRITQDVSNTANGLGPLVRGLIHHSALIIIYSIYLFSTSVWLTLGALAMIFLQFGLTVFLKKPLRRTARKYLDRIADFTGTLQEMFVSIRVIKSFGAEEYELRKLKNDISSVARSDIRQGVVTLIEPYAREILDSFAIIGIFLIATVQLMKGSLSVEGFLLFVFVGRLIIEPINKFNVNIAWIQMLLGSYERLDELFSERPQVVDGPKEKNSFVDTIYLEHVSFSYGADTVIKEISLELKKGNVLAFVGPSGGGKSTLVDLILRFYDPQEGRIFMDGINIKELKVSSYRRIFGVVPQETLLFNDTIENNIRYGRDHIPMKEVIEAAQVANAHNFIMGLPQKYSTKVGDRGVRLSGGERQRIAIARAIVDKPQIIIFDEATSSLDTDSEKQVQVAIECILKNSTAMVIAHRLSTILHADKIVVLNKGRIEAIGKHKELLNTSETYSRLYHLQFEANKPKDVVDDAGPILFETEE